MWCACGRQSHVDDDGVGVCAQNGHASTCKALVDAGAVIDAPRDGGFTPLYRLRHISITIRNLDWLRFTSTYVVRCRY
eukprot:COSAG01_NODE_6310_length_3744_cov_1.544033_2_plen_78_part_00